MATDHGQLTSPIDLGAPIVPGLSAAGIVLGEPLDPALAASAFAVERIAHHGVRYSFDAVRVSTRYGLTTRIDLSAGYRGTIGGAIGIGSTIAQVEAHAGEKVAVDQDSRHVVSRTAGWSFDTTPRAAGEAPFAEGEARVSTLSVFTPPS